LFLLNGSTSLSTLEEMLNSLDTHSCFMSQRAQYEGLRSTGSYRKDRIDMRRLSLEWSEASLVAFYPVLNLDEIDT
jgi:hypothetical protein